MNSLNFILEELHILFSLIEGIEIRYEYKSNLSTHLIEVKPLDLYNSSELYIEKEIELEERFSKLYPNEDLVFVSEDSLSKIENPNLTLHYKLFYQSKNENLINKENVFGFELEFFIDNNYALAA